MKALLLLGGKGVRVTLSRRNLRTLLHKLDQEDSQRTIYKFGNAETAEPYIEVTAEDDAAHYGDSTPGPMDESTEAMLRSAA